MFIDDATLIRAPPLRLLQLFHPPLQGLHHAPQDHRELLVVQGQQLAVAHGLAEHLAQFPGSQDVLGDEADLILGALHTIVDLGFQFVEELLRLFLRDLPDVLLELPIRRVHVAIPEDHFAVVVPSRVRLDKHVRQPAGRVEAHQFVQGVELKPAGGQRHQLALASRAVVVCGQEEPRHSRGRLVDDGQLAEAAGVPEPRDRGKLGVHLQPRGAAGEEQVGQAGLRGDGPVDPQRVVDQDALRTSLDREPGRGRVAAHQRRFDAEVADDLQVGGEAAVGVEGARGRRAAHGELRDVRRGGVQGAGRRHRHVSVQADASVGEAGQQRPVFLADRYQGVLDLEVTRRALQLGRLHEGGGGEAVDRQIGGGGDAAAVLQGGDAAVDGADVRLQGGHPAVDGVDRCAQGVEIGNQGVAPVRLAFAPAVASDLQCAAVAQDWLTGEGALAEQIPYHHGGELGLNQVEDPASFGSRGVGEVACVQGRQVVAPQEAGVRFRFGPAVAAEAQRGQVAEDGVALEGRFQEQVPYDSGGKLLLDQVEDVAAFRARRADEVAGVCGGLVQEAGDGVVDLRLGSPRRPVLGEGRCQQRIQLGAGVEQRIGLGRGVIIGKIHVPQGVCDLLIDFGPGVEVEQRGNDLGVDLAAVVVARQSRGDGRGHRAARGVVTELASHVGRDLRLVPVGHQGRGNEGQHLRLVLELGQVQGVDGCGDRCASFRLRVGFAPGVAVRLDEDRVVQVLEAGGQGAGHGQVAQHVAAPQQVERGPAGPGLAVAQRDGRQRRRDGCVPLGRSPVGRQRVGNGLVHLDRGAVGHQRPCDCGVPLCGRPVGHQRIGDGLGHLSRGAVIGQLGVGVGLALVDGRHHSDGDFGSREVIGEGRGDGVVRLLGRVRIAAEAQGPVVVGELDAQGARCVEVADLVGAGQQVPGHVADPSGGVDQIGGASEGGDLRQDPVDGGLQGDLQVAEVSCRGEGPGVLEG